MAKRTQKQLVTVWAIFLATLCAFAVVFWVVPNSEMSFALTVWGIVYLVFCFAPFEDKIFEKIVGVKARMNEAGMINAIIASVLVSLVWGSIYLFRIFF